MDRLVALGRYGSEAEAALWAELLEHEGVPAVLVPLGPGAGGWGVSAGLPHELRVRAGDLERARALVEELAVDGDDEAADGDDEAADGDDEAADGEEEAGQAEEEAGRTAEEAGETADEAARTAD